MLYELLYTSVSTRVMGTDDLVSLLEQARIKNARLGVTGLLVYHNREFMQLLEGEKNTVLSLWQTIRSDERHMSARSIYEGELDERGFVNWRMGFHELTDMNAQELDGFSNFLSKGFTSEVVANNPSVARRLMENIGEFFFK